jgi:hypothetical protein
MEGNMDEKELTYDPQLKDIMFLVQEQIKNKAKYNKSESRDKEIEWGFLYLILQQLGDIDRVSLLEIDRKLYLIRDEIKVVLKQIKDEISILRMKGKHGC